MRITIFHYKEVEETVRSLHDVRQYMHENNLFSAGVELGSLLEKFSDRLVKSEEIESEEEEEENDDDEDETYNYYKDRIEALERANEELREHIRNRRNIPQELKTKGFDADDLLANLLKRDHVFADSKKDVFDYLKKYAADDVVKVLKEKYPLMDLC